MPRELHNATTWLEPAGGNLPQRAFPPLFQDARPRRPLHGLMRARDALVETLWTTRCVICDAPGSTLCADCQLKLPYIDRWLACPRCGAPNGIYLCTDCNTLMLHEAGRDSLPFERCVNAIEHSGPASGIVVGFKDAGERRLAIDIARIMWRSIPREWISAGCTLSYIPADRRARMRRGFDHMQLVSAELAALSGLPCAPLLHKEGSRDQRGLDRRQRFENMARSISALPAASGIENVLLIDDVHTTGATLFAACDALHAAGVKTIRCATFARAT